MASVYARSHVILQLEDAATADVRVTDVSTYVDLRQDVTREVILSGPDLAATLRALADRVDAAVQADAEQHDAPLTEAV